MKVVVRLVIAIAPHCARPQFAIVVRAAGQAGERVAEDIEFHHSLAHPRQPLALGVDDHSLGHWRRAAGRSAPHASRRGPTASSASRSRALFTDSAPLVVRFFNGIKHFSGIATPYDECAENHLAAVKLICIRMWCAA